MATLWLIRKLDAGRPGPVDGDDAAHAKARTDLIESHERALKSLQREHAKTLDLCRTLEKLVQIKLNFASTASQVTAALDPEKKLLTPGND